MKKYSRVIVPWTINSGFANASHKGEFEFSKEEWEKMTSEEREKELSQLMEDEIANHIDAGYGEPIYE